MPECVFNIDSHKAGLVGVIPEHLLNVTIDTNPLEVCRTGLTQILSYSILIYRNNYFLILS